MRAVHNRLREALDLVRHQMTSDAGLDRELLLYCRGFCTALARHHTSEDTVLFPELEARHLDLADVLRNLRQDHSMMAHLITQLEHVLDTTQNPQELEQHVDGIGAIMESHFRFEEAQLLGVLVALDLTADVDEVLGAF